MALTTLSVDGIFTVLATASKIELVPAYAYEDGERTDKRRTDSAGHELFSVRGALPIIQGEVVPDGSIFVRGDGIDSAGASIASEIGQVLTIEGVFSARAARGYGLTGTLTGAFMRGEV